MEQRQLYLDLLRVVSIFAVIVIHISAPVVVSFSKTPADHWLTANIFDSLSRFCVPVFFMISGALILGDTRNYQVSYLFRKRVLRVFIPFIIWSFIYTVFFLQFQGKLPEFNFTKTLYSITTTPAHYHLWFLYTLMGLYLLVPLLGVFASRATDSQIYYFLILWFLFGICNPLLSELTGYKLPLFSLPANLGEAWLFSGYFILGFFLSKKEINYKLSYAFTITLIGAIITIWSTHYFSYKYNKFYELFYMYLSPNVLIMTIGIFLSTKTICNKYTFTALTHNIITTLSTLSFGIYLIHLIIYTQVNKYLHLDNSVLGNNPLHPLIGITLTSVCVFIFSAIATYLIRRLPLLGKWLT